ncbi:unnamed protein product [Bemisia tabaci]|uniref:UBA domain-containing protein n=1 Tax=Bemisia tabaci TaxID=7038 RepID=A0A9P0G1C5_BEMTA|nr:unnamed protein product [Bemisia tabaci]
MSSSNRTTGRSGGKNTAVKKNESAPVVSKAHKNEAKKTESAHVTHKATAEQIRMAQTTTIDTKADVDPKLASKIKKVMEFTSRSEDEVILAFHDCDNDLERAIEYLLSENVDSQWSVSKKKRRAASQSKPGGEPATNHHANEAEAEKEEESEAAVTGNGTATANNTRRGGRRGGPPRANDRSADAGKWKGKENKENEKNASDSRGRGRDGGFRRDRGDRGGRGMANGSVGRGGLGGRGRGGRGGGRLSTRTYQPRGDKPGISRTIDTWNNPSVENSATEKMGNWENDFPVPEEWDNEEYTGSLTETKVFTPSSAVPEEPTVETTSTLPTEESQDLSSITKAPSPHTQQGVMGMGTTLTAAQTQFLSQLTQQHSQHSTDAMKQPSSVAPTSATQSNSYSSMYQTNNEPEQQNTQSNSYQSMYHPSSQSITSTYSTSSVPFPPSSYGNSMVSNYGALQDVTSQSQSLPPRNKPQRARVPPPSKIPSSAVEMPPADGSVSSNISFLDVQFGGLEFGTNDTSFDNSLVNSTDQNKYSSNNTSLNSSTSVVTSLAELSLQNSSNVAPVSIDPYANLSSVSSQQKPTQPSSVSSVLNQASKALGNDSLLQSSNDKQSGSTMGSYSSGSASQSVRSTSTALQDLAAKAAANTASVGASEVPSLSSYGVPDPPASYNQQSSATSVYPKPNSSVSSYHQPSQSLGSSYNASSYSNPSQVTSSSIAYSSGGNQSQGSSYTPVTNSSYNSQQSSYTSNSSSYQPSSNYSTYPSYPNSQTYQNNSGSQSGGGYQNQSSYNSGNSSSLTGNSSSYGGSYPTTYNSSSSASQQNHKISSSSLTSSSASKESQVKYDTGSTAITTAAPALSSLSQTTISSTKASSTSTGAKSGIVPSLPPGVPPQMVGTPYTIMSQGNVPAYFQQPIYSYEDLHMIPQRLPAVPTGYYDISATSYPAPTSLAAGREGIPNVAYSMSDARFTRTDNNASPVSSTISQQNASQAHQQPLMNPAFQPSYATYYISPNFVQPNLYGPPGALYPITPTAASAGGHSAGTSGQYGKGPGAYGTAAGYGTGYDANGLSGQTGSDYKGSGVYANSQSQSGKGVATTNNPTQTTSATASDLGTANMYSKSAHSTLAKVNSYDKQGFHSGNPPPFPMPGNQSAGAYQQVFISATNPMVQSAHALHLNPARRPDSSNVAGSRTPASAQPNKTGSKPSYSSSNFWPQN